MSLPGTIAHGLFSGTVNSVVGPVQTDVQADLAQAETDAGQVLDKANADIAATVEKLEAIIVRLETQSQAWLAESEKWLTWLRSIVPGTK